MDTFQQIITYVGFSLSIISTVIGVINHKRIRSKCCGSVKEVSLDISDTTPPNPKNINRTSDVYEAFIQIKDIGNT